MKEFYQFIISFCIVCAVLGGIYILFPNGKLSKSVKYAVSLCMICAFLGIFSVSFNLNIKPQNKIDFKTESSAAEETAKAIIEKALKNNNIKFDKISVFTDKTQNGDIIISKITVFTSEEKEKIEETIGNGEYEVEVINE